MGSFGNSPNPWGSSFDTYKDCSQGLCSIYCPQWCYLMFPPPPPFFGLENDSNKNDNDTSASDFSPLIIAVIGILASAFILLSYYTLISKYCRRHRSNDDDSTSTTAAAAARPNDDDDNDGGEERNDASFSEGVGERVIKSIKVYKYKRGDGFVDGTDCSVCLSEFEEDEALRLLPKCNHAFHAPCIDTWLKSHTSCPLCRSDIAAASDAPSLTTEQRQIVRGSEAVVVVVVAAAEEEEESSTSSEVVVGPKRDPISALSGFGSGSGRILVADILCQDEDEDEDDVVDQMENGVAFNCVGCVGTSSNHDDDDDES